MVDLAKQFAVAETGLITVFLALQPKAAARVASSSAAARIFGQRDKLRADRSKKDVRRGVKRKQHSAEFKARVATAARSGEKTLAELSAEFGVHPMMISGWKQELVKRAGELFARSSCGDGRGDDLRPTWTGKSPGSPRKSSASSRSSPRSILALSAEIRSGTIDHIMEMSDLELGLKALLGGSCGDR
jgi:transposase